MTQLNPSQMRDQADWIEHLGTETNKIISRISRFQSGVDHTDLINDCVGLSERLVTAGRKQKQDAEAEEQRLLKADADKPLL